MSRCFIIEREEGLETELTKVMPGCQFKTWHPVYADAQAYGALVTDLASRIEAKLRTQKEDISIRKLKGSVMGSSRVSLSAWQRALHKALEQNSQWKREYQSLTRAA